MNSARTSGTSFRFTIAKTATMTGVWHLFHFGSQVEPAEPLMTEMFDSRARARASWALTRRGRLVDIEARDFLQPIARVCTRATWGVTP